MLKVTGIDYWGVAYGYGQAMCEKNAASEGVGSRCAFQHGDANKLDFPDESFRRRGEQIMSIITSWVRDKRASAAGDLCGC